MPKITSVEPQKKNPKRFNIFLDGVFAFGADEDLVVDFRLIPGKVIDPQDLDKLVFEAEVGKLMERMYAWFGVRGRSEKETRDYLRNLSFKRKLKDKEEISELVVERLLEKLKQKGMINDLEFVKAWVESKSKKKGLNVIKAELFKKGINREMIEEILNQESGIKNQGETAESVLEKRLDRWKGLPLMERKRKAYEFLMRRGFEYEIVKVVVEKMVRI